MLAGMYHSGSFRGYCLERGKAWQPHNKVSKSSAPFTISANGFVCLPFVKPAAQYCDMNSSLKIESYFQSII